MLSVNMCRELLCDAGRCLSDGEIERVRNQLHSLAELAVNAAQMSLRPDVQLRQEAWERIPPDEVADIHERAAIMEFQGGLSRDEAERRAIALCCAPRKEDGRCGP